MSKLTLWKQNRNVAPKKTPKVPRANDFENTMRSLQAASGRFKYRVIPVHCARHDKPYVVIFKKGMSDPVYTIEEIVGQSATNIHRPYIQQGSDESCKTERVEFDPSELDCEGLYCPMCNDTQGLVICRACDGVYCGGSVERLQNNSEYYRCVPRCGSRGKLSTGTKLPGLPDEAPSTPNSKFLNDPSAATRAIKQPKQRLLPSK